ncbi:MULTISPECIES: ABC transporter ATP-binding protein [Gardnerella]|uniref:ABC transporter ATP-binding protein n=1 Tax=Gardnerella TaxID=2701 RepID=UPI000352DF62|nr:MULTISPECIES: ABC transporter ATP-binding protein [Gardnerella]EPI54149.1 ABC transporter, ATP-binding protein [Gardnerella pickettii JCP7659]NSX26696.1 ABC transporter ATP-binding protein [Gardnerella vaginalis]
MKAKSHKKHKNYAPHAFRTIMPLLKRYRMLGVITSVAIFVEASMQIAIPTVMSSLIDFGIAAKSQNAVKYYGLQLLAFAAISMIFGVISGVCCAHSSAGFGKNLRCKMFSRLQSLSFCDLDRFSTGTVVTRLTSDVSNIQFAYQMVIRAGVRSLVIIVAAWWFTFCISPSISWVFLSLIPIVGVICGIGAKIVAPTFARIYGTIDNMNSMVSENLRNIRIVKSYVREDYENRRFRRISHKIYSYFLRAEYVLNCSIPLFNLCFYACLLLIAWMASKQIVASGNNPAFGLTTGNLAALVVYALQILFALANLVVIFVMTVTARTSMHRVANVLQSHNSEYIHKNPITELADASICFNNVDFAYDSANDFEHDFARVNSDSSSDAGDLSKGNQEIKDSQEILHNINLNIPSGSTVGIVGATGSGKSSIINLIARIYDVTKGTVFVGGSDVRFYDSKSLRNQIGIVLQKNILFSGTIAQNLRWGNEDASDSDLREACKIACAQEFINDLPHAYNTNLEQGGKNLSGGQKQRLCIARALLKRPKILILDDSMSAVDVKTDAKIRENLRHFMPDSTQIIVAQRVSSCMHADLIVVLKDGRVVAKGKHSELMESCETYRKMAISQGVKMIESKNSEGNEGVKDSEGGRINNEK